MSDFIIAAHAVIKMGLSGIVFQRSNFQDYGYSHGSIRDDISGIQ